jgi:hypothetical protein
MKMSLEEAENILLTLDDTFVFEKAHSNGEIHPNGKYVWVESARGGKGDWRVINNKNNKDVGNENKEKSSNNNNSSDKKSKSLEEHAKDLDEEKLKKVIENPKTPENLKSVAKKELDSRLNNNLSKNTDKMLKLLKEKKFSKLSRTQQIKIITGIEAECLKSMSELKQTFSDSEAESLDVYASVKYKEINKILREGITPPKSLQKIIKDIDNVFKKNTLEKDIIVFRGTSGIEKIDAAYKSTSVNLYSAYNFSLGENSTIDAYKIPKGTSFAFIGGGEYEVLLPPNIDLMKYKL